MLSQQHWLPGGRFGEHLPKRRSDIFDFCMPLRLELAEDQRAIHFDLEAPAITGYERPILNIRLKFIEKGLRQPDGAREVLSNRAVGDRNVQHRDSYSGWWLVQ